MKTLQDLLSVNPIYLFDWNNKTKLDVLNDFEYKYLSNVTLYKTVGNWMTERGKDVDIETYKPTRFNPDNINILFATYGRGSYDGDAFVLFEYEGKLYEVNASHCSCYGLEGQFEPEETSIEAISDRLINGNMGDYSDHYFKNALMLYLGITQQEFV